MPTVTSRFAPWPQSAADGADGAESVVGGEGTGEEPAEACVRGMLDLSSASGLPLWLDPLRATLVLAQPLLELRPDPQPLRLLRDVLLDPEAPAPEVPYTVFRGVALATDDGVFEEHGVRHDLVVLHEGRIGREYVKTRGHIASCPEAKQCPEAYGVLHGHALFLAQQPEEGAAGEMDCAHLRDVRWIEAWPGQKVIVPADYGVVIVNLGAEPLAVSSLVAVEAWPVNVAYERMRGAGYYVMDQAGEPAAEPNLRYHEPLPSIGKEAPLEAPDLGVEEDAPLYSTFVHHPERFGWLREGAPSMGEGC